MLRLCEVLSQCKDKAHTGLCETLNKTNLGSFCSPCWNSLDADRQLKKTKQQHLNNSKLQLNRKGKIVFQDTLVKIFQGIFNCPKCFVNTNVSFLAKKVD